MLGKGKKKSNRKSVNGSDMDAVKKERKEVKDIKKSISQT